MPVFSPRFTGPSQFPFPPPPLGLCARPLLFTAACTRGSATLFSNSGGGLGRRTTLHFFRDGSGLRLFFFLLRFTIPFSAPFLWVAPPFSALVCVPFSFPLFPPFGRVCPSPLSVFSDYFFRRFGVSPPKSRFWRSYRVLGLDVPSVFECSPRQEFCQPGRSFFTKMRSIVCLTPSLRITPPVFLLRSGATTPLFCLFISPIWFVYFPCFAGNLVFFPS